MRAITRGPLFHWFGYYDKHQFDPTNRYVLGMASAFEDRQPKPDDVIRIGMVDLHDGDKWIDLDETRAWCWQQGCMLQWLPASDSEIIWNDREGDHFVCHILDVKTRKKRTLPHPVYSVSPDGTWAVSTSFARLADVYPGYGYSGVRDPFADALAPDQTGVFRVDLRTGEQRLLVSLAELARIPFASPAPDKAKHHANHLLVNTDGTRFTFLHRWQIGADGSFLTRMVTMNPDGSGLRVLNNSGFVSHFVWRDPTHILAYAKSTPLGEWNFAVFEDRDQGGIEIVGKGIMESRDGHCTYLPGARWILNDTYPDKNRDHQIYLFDTKDQRRVNLAKFHEPAAYYTDRPYYERRVDTHPRCSRDGRFIVVDGVHPQQGRQMHLMDVSAVVG